MLEEQNSRTGVPLVAFGESKLWRLVCRRADIPADADIVQIVDYARTSTAKSDQSAILTAALWSDGITRRYFVVDIAAERWSPLELAQAIVDQARKYQPKIIFIEKPPMHQLLEWCITQHAVKRGVPLAGLRFFNASNLKAAKAKRL